MNGMPSGIDFQSAIANVVLAKLAGRFYEASVHLLIGMPLCEVEAAGLLNLPGELRRKANERFAEERRVHGDGVAKAGYRESAFRTPLEAKDDHTVGPFVL